MNHPTLRASLMCEDYALKSNGSLVLFGIFWVIQAYRVPARYGPILFVNMWTGGQGEFEEQVDFISADSAAIFASIGPSPLRLGSVDQVVPSIFKLVLPVTEFGTNWVRVRLNGELVLEYPLSVVPIHLDRQVVEEGDLVQGAGPEIYAVQGGRRHHIPDPETFNRLGYDWNMVKRVPEDQLQEIPSGPPITRRSNPRAVS